MTEAGALAIFGWTFLAVAVMSEKYSPLIGIGLLLLILGLARMAY